MRSSASGAKCSMKCMTESFKSKGSVPWLSYCMLLVYLCLWLSVVYSLCVIVIVVQHVGDLGNIVAGPDGRASFRQEDRQLKVTQKQSFRKQRCRISTSSFPKQHQMTAFNFFFIDTLVHTLQVWDVIGRSLVVDAAEDDLGRGNHPLSKQTGNSGERWVNNRGLIYRGGGAYKIRCEVR